MPSKKKKILAEVDQYYLEYGIDLENRVVDLDDEVDELTMGWIKRAIKLMIKRDSEAPILLNISSYGGNVYDGLGLYDLLRKAPCPIHTHCEGYAMSMGLILFVAGDVRTADENSTFMTHSVSSGAWGKAFEIEVDSKEITRLNKLMAILLADRTTKNVKWWEKEIKYEDKYYTVEQAKRLGILG